MGKFRRIQSGEILKVAGELGIVYGFAIVSTIKGEPYYDLHGDHIPEDAMMKAAAAFMSESRTGKEMHSGDRIADILFAFPLTADVAKGLGIETEKTGLLIGFKPHDPAVLDKFRSGEYTGFSIGGYRGEDEEIDE